MPNYSDIEEVNFSGGLIPDGRCEMFNVLFDKDTKTTEKGDTYYNVTLECLSGQYAGSKLYDNIAVSGQPGYFLQRGKTAIKYMLETTRQAHQNPEKYNISSIAEINPCKVVAKVGIKIHTNKEGKQMLVNEIKAYGSPRADSSNNKFYVAWAKGEQLWETDKVPVIGGAANGATRPVHNDLSDEIPF